jgi:predicted house-cleaning noncanonical NTP pyrophosphatase (MazG superfamily)
MIHNKLVRDKIPAEINARGATCTFFKLEAPLGKEVFGTALAAKLVEEAGEVRTALTELRCGVVTREQLLEELADLQTALDCLMHEMGFDSRQLNDALCKKMREKGRFTERIFLVESWEPGELPKEPQP